MIHNRFAVGISFIRTLSLHKFKCLSILSLMFACLYRTFDATNNRRCIDNSDGDDDDVGGIQSMIMLMI